MIFTRSCQSLDKYDLKSVHPWGDGGRLNRGTLQRWQRRSFKYDDSHIDICQVRSCHRLVAYYNDPHVPILPGQVRLSQSVIVYNNDINGTTMSGQNT